MNDGSDSAASEKGSPEQPVTERLHALERGDDRTPLFLMVAEDAEGRVLTVTACDPEDAR